MSVSIDGARLAQIMNSAVEQTYGKDAAKNVKFEAKGDSITVSYTDEAGNVHNGVPIELSPADVDALADPAAMESVLKKISKDIKLDDPGVKEFLKCLNKTVNDVLKNGSVPMPDGSDLPIKDIPNIYVTLFAIMALMQEAAKTMKESAVASRESALKSEVQAIMNQAAQEKAMAWTSLISSFVTMGVQVGVSSFLKGKEIKADIKANQELTKQGVDMNKMLMDDTMKLGDVGETQKCMELRGADLDSVKTMKDIAADVGGFDVDSSGRLEVNGSGAKLIADAKTGLDTASKNLEAAKKMPIVEVPGKGEGPESKPTYKFGEQEFATMEDAEKAQKTKIDDLTQEVNEKQSKVDGLEVAGAKAELDKLGKDLENAKKMPIEEVSVKVENPEKGGKPDETSTAYKFDGKEFKTKEDAEKAKNTKIGDLTQKVNDQKGKLVGLMDQKVNNIRDGLEIAEADLARAEANGGDTSGLQRKVNMERKNLIYANTVRNHALSEPIGGDKNSTLLGSKQIGARMAHARMDYRSSFEGAKNSLQYSTLRIQGEKWGAASQAFGYAAQFLGTLSSALPEILMKDKVTEQAGMLKEAEAAYMSANDLVQSANETQRKIVQMFEGFFQSNIQSGRMV